MSSLSERVRDALAPEYLVERVLGEGGMGVVFRARDTRLARIVAIKVLRPELATATAVARFVREAQFQANLSRKHPNIIQVYHAADRDGLSFYVMECLEGETLRSLLEAGPLGARAVRGLGRALLDALAAAHRSQIVHRDIKPANVFLTGDRTVLTDFGVAHADHSDTTLTTPGQLIGTRRYMAPEQLVGKPATTLSDIYAVGAVLYEACTGRQWLQTTAAQQGDWSGIPRWLTAALRAALEIDPNKRWQSAEQFRNALDVRTARLPILVGVPLGALLIAAFGAVRFCAPPVRQPRPPTAARPTMSVVPFADGGDGSFGRQLARDVATQLEWFRRWDFVLRDTASNGVSTAQGTHPPTRLRAEGDIIARGGDTTFQLMIRAGERLEHVVEVPGNAHDRLGWARSIADSIVRRTFPQFADEFRYYAQRSSRNVPAHEALNAGQDAFRRDAWAEAETYFQRALEHDPRFAQAAWNLALIRKWRRDSSHTLILRTLYDSQRDDLPPLQRLLTEAELEPDLEQRIALFAEAARRFPRSTDASLLFGNELYHRGPLIGIPLDSGIAVLESTAMREMFSTARVHAVLGHIRLGHQPAAARELSLLPPEAPGDAEGALRERLLLYAYDERFRPVCALVKRFVLGGTGNAELIAGFHQYARLANLFDIPVAQGTLGAVLARKGADRSIRASGIQAEGLSLILQGRPTAAFAMFDSAASLFGSPEAAMQASEWRLLLPSLGLPMQDSTASLGARSRLVQTGGALAARAAWALALDAIARGDAALAGQWIDSLTTRTAAYPRALPLLGLARALTLAARGQPDSALRMSEPLLRYDPAGLGGDPFGRAVLYANRAAWQRRTGAAAAADRTLLWVEAWDIHEWPQREAQSGEVDVAVGAVARLRRAELAAAAGRFELAHDLASRVDELWADAEPSYAGLRETARALARHRQ